MRNVLIYHLVLEGFGAHVTLQRFDCISVSERARSIIGGKTNELSKLEEPVRFYTGSVFMKLKPRNYVKLQHIFI